MDKKSPTKIAIADDHKLFTLTLALAINKFDDCTVIFTATSATDAIEKMTTWTVPDILILDLSMPGMDGFEACTILNQKYPELKILILTQYHTDLNLVRALEELGVQGILHKSTDPDELLYAIHVIMRGEQYFSQFTSARVIGIFVKNGRIIDLRKTLLTEKEVKFMKLACSEMTYKEIHKELKVSTRAGEKIRVEIFEKLEVPSRVALAIYAVKHGIVGM